MGSAGSFVERTRRWSRSRGADVPAEVRVTLPWHAHRWNALRAETIGRRNTTAAGGGGGGACAVRVLVPPFLALAESRSPLGHAQRLFSFSVRSAPPLVSSYAVMTAHHVIAVLPPLVALSCLLALLTLSGTRGIHAATHSANRSRVASAVLTGGIPLFACALSWATALYLLGSEADPVARGGRAATQDTDARRQQHHIAFWPLLPDDPYAAVTGPDQVAASLVSCAAVIALVAAVIGLPFALAAGVGGILRRFVDVVGTHRHVPPPLAEARTLTTTDGGPPDRAAPTDRRPLGTRRCIVGAGCCLVMWWVSPHPSFVSAGLFIGSVLAMLWDATADARRSGRSNTCRIHGGVYTVSPPLFRAWQVAIFAAFSNQLVMVARNLIATRSPVLRHPPSDSSEQLLAAVAAMFMVDAIRSGPTVTRTVIVEAEQPPHRRRVAIATVRGLLPLLVALGGIAVFGAGPVVAPVAGALPPPATYLVSMDAAVRIAVASLGIEAILRVVSCG